MPERRNSKGRYVNLRSRPIFVSAIAVFLGMEVFSLDVHPPADWKDWKARLVYTPEVTGLKLLKWRLQDAWDKRSIADGFRLTGWDAARYSYSEELHE